MQDAPTGHPVTSVAVQPAVPFGVPVPLSPTKAQRVQAGLGKQSGTLAVPLTQPMEPRAAGGYGLGLEVPSVWANAQVQAARCLLLLHTPPG